MVKVWNKKKINKYKNKISINKIEVNEDNKKKRIKFNNKKYAFIMSLLMITVFTIIFTSSYAFFNTTVTSKEFVVYTGTLAVDYKKKTDVINLSNLYPMTNTQGLELTAHEFTIENNGNIDSRYQIRLEVSEDNMIPIEYIKVSYQENDNSYTEPVLLSNLNSSLVLLSNKVINPTKSNSYGIKLWIDINAPNDIQGKTFKARIVVDSIQNVEDGFITDTVPIITLNKNNKGNTDINLEVNDTYTELGVKKIDDDQDILTPNQVVKTYEYYDGSNLTTTDKIDTTKTGIYYITYSITDKSNNTGKAVRVVTVNNTKKIPTITLNGDSNVQLNEYDTYVDKNVAVEDNNQIITLGEVKTSTIGTYIIRYIVVDKNNNLNSVTRTVTINEGMKLPIAINNKYKTIETTPTLTTTSFEANENGLYKSTLTNSGEPTYYFRGNVENYLDFAGFTWRIVRINEDGTIRIVMQNGINDNATYQFNPTNSGYTYMYYSNSNVENGAKYTLNNWYDDKIASNTTYANRVATGEYYCEQAKVAYSDTWATNSGADMTVYTIYKNPNFECKPDTNGHGLVNDDIGLLSYDEVIYAGGYPYKENINCYLYNNTSAWTMSPAGFGTNASAWIVFSGGISSLNVGIATGIRPVINLKADTIVTGTGDSTNHWIVTN